VVCPFCSFESTRVLDSRDAGNSIRRRRTCESCGNRFTTYEEQVVSVVKRDGRRERFDRRKLLDGLMRAANKRPVTGEQLEELVDAIAAEVRRAGAEVDAAQIGDRAERGLARIDPVSAIQFAAVYRGLEGLDELESVVRRYKEERLPGADQLPLVPSGSERNIGRSPSGEQATEQMRRSHA
jgi:transcriptional repressor NrdR